MFFRFHDISISFGKKKVLKKLTASIPKGSIVTIIGKNGCGKSSLLRTVSKAVKPDTGSVRFRGRELSKYKPKDLARSIGYLPQVHTSPPDIDVRTLVSYGRYPYLGLRKVLSHEDKEIINECIHMTGLDSLRYQKVGTLSGGERQRAWIAMTLCQKPSVLILDEPTTYLDVSYQIEILEMIRNLNRKLGITIIMVLHDINMAARYSDIMMAIKDGVIFAQGKPCEIMNEEKLRDVFGLETRILTDEVNECPFFIPLKKAE